MAFKMRKPNPKGVQSPLPQNVADGVIDKSGTVSKLAKAVKYGTQGSAIAKNPWVKGLASKGLGITTLMLDPVSMGTNDTTDGIDHTAPLSDAEKKRVAEYKKKNFSWYNPNRYL